MSEAQVAESAGSAETPAQAQPNNEVKAPVKTSSRFKHNGISDAIEGGQKAGNDHEELAGKGVAKIEAADGKNVTEAQIKAAVRELGDEDLNSMVTLTINGKEKKITFGQLKAMGQKGFAGDEKLAEANKYKVAMHNLERLAEQDPWELMKLLGKDPDALAEARLQQKLKEMEMTPEQKQLHEMQAKLEKYEKTEKETKAQREQEAQFQQEAQIAQSIDTEMTKAFAESGLPKHKFYIAMVASEMLGAAKRGEDLTASDAVAMIKERYPTQVRETLAAQDAKTIHEWLGQDVIKKLREYDVSQITKVPTLAAKQSGPSNTEHKQRAPKMITEKQWREKFRNMT